jgi:hypothetical protein
VESGAWEKRAARRRWRVGEEGGGAHVLEEAWNGRVVVALGFSPEHGFVVWHSMPCGKNLCRAPPPVVVHQCTAERLCSEAMHVKEFFIACNYI